MGRGMTRAWDSHTQSALGGKKHTSSTDALGPSLTPAYYTTVGTTHALSLDGREFVGKKSLGNETFTTYTCYTDIGACASAPGDNTKAKTGVTTFTIYLPYTADYGTATDHTIDTDNIGIYEHTANTVVRCYETFRNSNATDFGNNLRIPRDVNEPIRYWLVTTSAAAESDRTTTIPACSGTGWSPSSPPADLVYREYPAALATCYHLRKRTAEDAAWTQVIEAGDLPAGFATYSTLRLAQHRGEIWCKTDTNDIEVWPIETLYSASSPTTITAPAANFVNNGFVTWGDVTVAQTSDSKLHIYNGTTYVSELGAPFSSASWNYWYYAFGWLTVAYTGGILLYLNTGSTLEYRQDFKTATLDIVRQAGPDHIIAADADDYVFHRLIYDHSAETWSDAGEIPHVQEAWATDGYDYWWDTVYRHVVLRKTVGGTYEHRLVQVF